MINAQLLLLLLLRHYLSTLSSFILSNNRTQL